ncbi:fumarylacetoacetase [Ideonella margarita]|uniref:fumarylacetoacetase n=1 Tax=Ideonella margarita TaxID=2984191 RepID=A0ABU9CCE4_9BURK
MSATYPIDHTHDPAATSWVSSANQPGSPFPLQNLPFGRFRLAGSGGECHNGEWRNGDWHIGVAIGDQVLCLRTAGLVDHADMHRLMAQAPTARQALRHALFDGLKAGSAKQAAWAAALVPQADVEMGLPCPVGDYTDFYTSIHHATTVGRQFRPEQPLLPNYVWVPIGYHGRASSVIPSGMPVRRPKGQTRPAAGSEQPNFGPSRRLDHELELALFIGQGNALGEPIGIDQAEAHLFGVALFNDWSARDIQGWEYQPLGPFLAKNFASSVAPWMVTMEALAPFRQPFVRDAALPAPLPYLSSPDTLAHGVINIELEVWLQTAQMREAGHPGDRISQSNYADAFWTAAQLVTHHTVNGCNLQPGDLLGTGTLSGPMPEQAASMLELSNGGQAPITLSTGEQRSFLEDGDSVILKGWCNRAGAARIGLGECRATVLPARA